MERKSAAATAVSHGTNAFAVIGDKQIYDDNNNGQNPTVFLHEAHLLFSVYEGGIELVTAVKEKRRPCKTGDFTV